MPPAASRHQACGTSDTVCCSASPSSASTNTSTRAARQASTSCRGKSPRPATMPTLMAIRLLAVHPFGLADRAARIRPDEGDDVGDGTNPTETLGRLVDPVVQGAIGRKQQIVGTTQTLDVLAAETATLHADDVTAVEAGARAHLPPLVHGVAV